MTYITLVLNTERREIKSDRGSAGTNNSDVIPASSKNNVSQVRRLRSICDNFVLVVFHADGICSFPCLVSKNADWSVLGMENATQIVATRLKVEIQKAKSAAGAPTGMAINSFTVAECLRPALPLLHWEPQDRSV